MRRVLMRLLDSRRTLVFASLFSFALGLFFVFIWSPLPWGWEGIDHYHDQAIRLASGKSFATTDVPWGYAYFLAAFYAVFGIHAWIPLVAQLTLNALVPFLVYRLASPLGGSRIAMLAAVVTSVFSFNTVYAATQSTDSVSTVMFLAALTLALEGRRTGSWASFVAAGALGGLVAQFRPNLLLFPPFIAAAYLLERPRFGRKLGQVAVFLGAAGLVLAPWVIRNYRLMHVFLPTSTHGGVQLWYGTLQTGEYLESRADNPRKEFQGGTFDYTSIADEPLIVFAPRPTCRGTAADLTLTYWTDRDRAARSLEGTEDPEQGLQFVIPAQPAETAIYYYFDARWPESPEPVPTPPGGKDRPAVYFVSSDHFGDLDRHDDLFDLFDLIRILRTVAWNDVSSHPGIQDVNGDGRVDEDDVRRAVTVLAGAMGERTTENLVRAITPSPTAVRLELADGSWLEVPRAWQGRATDLRLDGKLAGELIHARLPRADINGKLRHKDNCALVEYAGINGVFYRRELDGMRRHTALALDNIRRDPLAYAASSAYRALRLFVINGSDAKQRSQQFANSGPVYAAGTVASALYLIVFLGGAIWAWRHRPGLRLLILPIVYIPLTICFVLTNMRYTITVQPLIFVFVAAAIVALLRLEEQTIRR
jgi:Dolichyl-phosphate-mannose-protein mannosyltransferase